MRGVVISEAIDIESQIENIIISYFAEKGDVIQKSLKRDNFNFGKKVMLIGSIAKKILSDSNTDQTSFSPVAETLKLLCKDVVWTRNVLSHVKHVRNKNGQEVLESHIKSPDGEKQIVVNTEWYKETRKKLKKHSENLEKLSSFITNGSTK